MTEKFNPGYFYHIYNRGNNRENIFFHEKNYIYFLKKFDEYLTNYLDIYAFCLLPNHFHFLVRVKENDSIALSDGIDTLVSEKFRRFFLGYSQAINKQQNRSGSLFQKNYRRKLIDKENYLTRIIYYIHLNPVLHRLNSSFEKYLYSSYRIILSSNPTKLKRKEVLELFTNINEFIDFHEMRLNEKIELGEYYLE